MNAQQLIENIPTETVDSIRKQIYGLLGENVGKYERDNTLFPMDQYTKLEEHHINETEFLIALLIKWGNTVRGLNEMLTNEQKVNETLMAEHEAKYSTRL